jgi:predicted nucleotidyltransferase
VPDPKVDKILAQVGRGLADLPGTVAVALGGSRARGTASVDSDIDIGLYYDPANRADFDELVATVVALDDRGKPDGFGAYGEWGPWINGGFWLRMSDTKVDILLRDIEKVRRTIADCAAGRPEVFYQVGHPHGFCTAIYAGEVNQNIAVLDAGGEFAALKALTDPYPEPLAEALIRQFGWESGFSIDTSISAARRGDAAYVCGCVFRTIACLNQVLFAAERRYLTNEKGAVAIAATLPEAPPDYAGRVAGVVGRLSGRPEDLTAALDALRFLHDDVMARAGQS